MVPMLLLTVPNFLPFFLIAISMSAEIRQKRIEVALGRDEMFALVQDRRAAGSNETEALT
jgi:hypothetical protein